MATRTIAISGSFSNEQGPSAQTGGDPNSW
jgi:hypothetical protein